MTKPWVVIPEVISSPASLIELHTKELLDKSAHASPGETRIVDGRQLLDEAVENAVADAFKRAADITGIEYSTIERISILRYRRGGEYSWHADNELVEGRERKLSMVISLNTGYEGGGTEFMWPRPGCSEIVKLPAGDAVVFPSFLYHRGRVTISGERWIIVAWADGVPFR
ncbi:2OG-Fe(II) oxygenase [Actinokineospora iranica]|uniref:Predicted 2-oxoglutarate-and Fe(II)-dependent dioxygenase YbiX n=1 Tax=Actinokineospora iranica TaxID=1271860 RepID=A0A1G6SA87_9PSEU|nr:2OG-Fe(II) oxygenase [Actinokineospora iranica]SDD13832.1 Predicted 2-oxoglutarate-and Fe(II)-dependent dioxygenase YbiX [Actinokineospora iranica]